MAKYTKLRKLRKLRKSRKSRKSLRKTRRRISRRMQGGYSPTGPNGGEYGVAPGSNPENPVDNARDPAPTTSYVDPKIHSKNS